MEMLLVSVKPGTHFKAKIAGVLLLALTQMGIIAIVFLIYAKFIKGGMVWDAPLALSRNCPLAMSSMLSYSYC